MEKIISVALLNPTHHMEGKWYTVEQLRRLSADPLCDLENHSSQQRNIELQERIAKLVAFAEALALFPDLAESFAKEFKSCPTNSSHSSPYAKRLGEDIPSL